MSASCAFAGPLPPVGPVGTRIGSWLPEYDGFVAGAVTVEPGAFAVVDVDVFGFGATAAVVGLGARAGLPVVVVTCRAASARAAACRAASAAASAWRCAAA